MLGKGSWTLGKGSRTLGKGTRTLGKGTRTLGKATRTPLEFFFQEQSYSSLHSGRSLAGDHVRGNIDDPRGSIADFCEVIAIPAALSRSLRQSAGADEATTIDARLAKHHKTLLNIVKHHETHVKHM